MGAKFLNDEEVASNEACMKLCCTTDECDVFIYEEKVRCELGVNIVNHSEKVYKR